jgi:alkyl hydroperoxide reductase subunit AhpC
MKVNEHAPQVRGPALVDGTLTYLDSARFRGLGVALSFLPAIGPRERSMLEYHASAFEREKAVFLGVVPESTFLWGPWQRVVWPKRFVLLSDPLGRLCKSYGVPRTLPSGRCHSFVIDHEGILRYHLVHDLNGRGMKALLETLKACVSAKTPQPKAPSPGIQERGERVEPLATPSARGEWTA